MAFRVLSNCLRLASTTIPSFSSHLMSKTVPALTAQPARFASKKSGGVVRNKIGRTKRKNRGLKVTDGEFVHQGTVLAKQYGIVYYPGENVVMDAQDWTLKAAYDGIVVLTTEELNPYPDSPLYQPIQKGFVMQKQFLSVIPTHLHCKFKLVSQT